MKKKSGCDDETRGQATTENRQTLAGLSDSIAEKVGENSIENVLAVVFSVDDEGKSEVRVHGVSLEKLPGLLSASNMLADAQRTVSKAITAYIYDDGGEKPYRSD